LSFEREFTFEGQTIPIHASIGGASFPEDSMDLEKLIETADSRMYAAKRSHRQNAASNPLNQPSKRNNPD
jgi:GGDEF domain-containing protein